MVTPASDCVLPSPREIPATLPVAESGTAIRVLLAMSGGVDSSASASLLIDQGYDVVGVTMKLHEETTDVPDRPCCSLDSTSDARRVAQGLGIPHYVLNLVAKFQRDVKDDFVREYAAGRTPIPCTRCNTFTKFRDLVRTADQIDATYIATGHYVRVSEGKIYRARDDQKDQSYFLWGLSPAVVPRLLFPVGDHTKTETRAVAAAAGMHLAQKKESQDICFVPNGSHVDILREALGDDAPALSPGPVVDETGTVVGMHSGFANYTVGQRKGLPSGADGPKYVLRIDPITRTVFIGPRAMLAVTRVEGNQPNWLGTPAEVGQTVWLRIRHRAPVVEGIVIECAEDRLVVDLHQSVDGVSPGQSMVCYAEDAQLLGGAIITSGNNGSPSSTRRSLPVL